METGQLAPHVAELIDINDADKVLDEVRGLVDRNGGKAGAVIRVLQQSQGAFGYLPAPVLETIAREMKMPLSEVYGIVSFYSFFTMKPRGRHVIQICMGTACYVKGGAKILDTFKKSYHLEPGGITEDRKFSLETVRCLGCCGLAPVLAVGKDVYRKVLPDAVPEILSTYQ
jgi:NADH:ubiquinone oxidoreductase subunit E